MHTWGDGFKYFKEVDEAAEYIGKFCAKWGRISVTQTKEKWGTARVYCHFGHYQLGSLLSPCTLWYGNWPWYIKWVWKVYIPEWFNNLFFPYQVFIYRLAYKKAIKKYPMIVKEIIYGADWNEHLKGVYNEKGRNG